MKKIKVLLSFVLMFVFVGVIANNAHADNNRADCPTTPISSKWGTSDVTFCEDTGVLNVGPGTLLSTHTAFIDSVDDNVDGFIAKTKIKKIILAENVKTPQDSSYLFGGSMIGSPTSTLFTELEEVEGNLDTSATDEMSYMFASTYNLNSLDVSKWNTSNVKDMSAMFEHTSVKILDVSNWDVSNVTNMTGLFNNTKNLEVLDLSNWDTINVQQMWMMLSGTGVKYFKMGEKSLFSTSVELNNVNESGYTGGWIKVDSDQGYQPSVEGIVFENSESFMNDYKGTSEQQGWYTWEKDPIVITEIEKPVLKKASKPGERPTLEIPENIVGYTFSEPEYVMSNEHEGVVKVKANILPGYVWNGAEKDLEFEYSFKLAIEVTPIAPKLEDVVECDNEPGLVTTEQDGVKYAFEKKDGKYIVEAIPEDGYYFSKGAQSKWEFDIVVVDCPIIVEPEVANPKQPKIPNTGSNDLIIALISIFSFAGLLMINNFRRCK